MRCAVEALDRAKVEKIMRSTSFSSCVCVREAHRPLCSMSGALCSMSDAVPGEAPLVEAL
jgi:hypothetical protein